MDKPTALLVTRRRGSWPLVAAIFLVSLFGLGWGIREEPIFVDEAAFVSQTYFWDLLTSGRVHDPLWLEYPAYDLPPLPKYLIGAAFQSQDIARVDRPWAVAWYANLHEQRFLTDRMLQTARWPSLLLGALGCVAVFLLGKLGIGWRAGLIAALLLAINPLYRLHSHRAMADVPAEALLLSTAALGLLTWKQAVEGTLLWRGALLFGLGVGVLGGFAVLAKLNGGLGLMIVGAWTLFGLILVRSQAGRVAGLSTTFVTTAIAALITFVLLNPFVWAHPDRMGSIPLASPVAPDQSMVTRLGKIISHRFEIPRGQQVLFPHNALTTPWQKLCTLAVQGFGRFGPFGPLHSDSTVRFENRQDWGGWIWIPGVLAGAVFLLGIGTRQRAELRAPTAWAILVMAGVSFVTVGWFLPLAWDRFFLSIQASSALLAAAMIDTALGKVLAIGSRR